MKRSIFYLSLLYVLGSCSSFKEVKAFATNSGKVLKAIKILTILSLETVITNAQKELLKTPIFKL